MRTHHYDVTGFGFEFFSGRFGYAELTLTGDIGLLADGPLLHLLNPNGADRSVTLPAFEPGIVFMIAHTGTADDLNIKNSSGTTLATIGLKECIHVYSTRNSWILSPWTFGAVGSDHRAGLVPDPGPTPAADYRFLADDGTWKSVTEAGALDAYKTVSDGTNTAVAEGLDTLRFRSSDSTLTITVTNNHATFGDNIDIVVVESNVDHDALANFSADEHVAHSAIDIVAGAGLSGGGTIAASRTIALDLSELGSIAIAAADLVPFWDTSGSVNGQCTFTAFNAALDHNALANYDANRHFDHTAISISPGTGLTGGGTIAATRTLSIDWNGLTAKPEGMAAGDLFAYYDASLAGHYKIRFDELNSALDHDTLANFSANEHIDHTAVSITGTGNLTGGGTIAASRTLDMASMAQYRVKGRISSGAGTPEDLTGADVQETIYQGLTVAEKTSAGAYSMASADDIILINKGSGEATTVNLVTAAGRKRPVKIVDLRGDAATNNITIDGATTETICGATTWVINFNYGSVILFPRPDGTGWYI